MTEVLRYRPGAGEYVWTFGGTAPVARIAPGTVLEVFTEDCFAGRVRGTGDLVSEVIEFPFVNPQTGPFYVDAPHRHVAGRAARGGVDLATRPGGPALPVRGPLR